MLLGSTATEVRLYKLPTEAAGGTFKACPQGGLCVITAGTGAGAVAGCTAARHKRAARAGHATLPRRHATVPPRRHARHAATPRATYATPHHATPHHATPRHATPRHATTPRHVPGATLYLCRPC
eukprot:scaffold53276_cov62-Phaeocystis_antarctica.AAC.3